MTITITEMMMYVCTRITHDNDEDFIRSPGRLFIFSFLHQFYSPTGKNILNFHKAFAAFFHTLSLNNLNSQV